MLIKKLDIIKVNALKNHKNFIHFNRKYRIDAVSRSIYAYNIIDRDGNIIGQKLCLRVVLDGYQTYKIFIKDIFDTIIPC